MCSAAAAAAHGGTSAPRDELTSVDRLRYIVPTIEPLETRWRDVRNFREQNQVLSKGGDEDL